VLKVKKNEERKEKKKQEVECLIFLTFLTATFSLEVSSRCHLQNNFLAD